jgi:hypothetical protein
MVTVLVEGTLTNGNDNTFVQSFLGLFGNKDTRGSFLSEEEEEKREEYKFIF